MIAYCVTLILTFIALAIFTLACAGLIIKNISSPKTHCPMCNLEKKGTVCTHCGCSCHPNLISRIPAAPLHNQR